MTATKADILLRGLVGIPYVSRGRRMEGADCWGIVRLFHEHMLGSALPSYLDLYQDADDANGTTLAFALGKRSWRQVEPGRAEMGDAVLFRLAQHPCHCGVLTGRGSEFLHTLRGRNSALETLDSIMWRNRVMGVYRWTS